MTSITSFENYQRGRGSNTAWTWEHQAITRARCCAGPTALAERFEATRRAVMAAPRDADALRQEISAMREKVRQAHPSREGRFDVKHSDGGMMDAEFAVQYLVLTHSARRLPPARQRRQHRPAATRRRRRPAARRHRPKQPPTPTAKCAAPNTAPAWTKQATVFDPDFMAAEREAIRAVLAGGVWGSGLSLVDTPSRGRLLWLLVCVCAALGSVALRDAAPSSWDWQPALAWHNPGAASPVALVALEPAASGLNLMAWRWWACWAGAAGVTLRDSLAWLLSWPLTQWGPDVAARAAALWRALRCAAWRRGDCRLALEPTG